MARGAVGGPLVRIIALILPLTLSPLGSTPLTLTPSAQAPTYSSDNLTRSTLSRFNATVPTMRSKGRKSHFAHVDFPVKKDIVIGSSPKCNVTRFWVMSAVIFGARLGLHR